MDEQVGTEKLDLAAFDLEAAADRGAALHLVHPVSGKRLGVVIRLAGTDGKRYREVVRSQIDAQITEGKAELSAAELEARHVARLAAMTLSWDGVRYGGDSLPCTVASARRLYQEQVWIREQVAAFVEERAHFFPAYGSSF